MEWYGNWTSWRPLDRDPWTPEDYPGKRHGTPTEVRHSITEPGLKIMRSLADDQAAYMRLAFNGTGAWVYGSTARNHGAYSGMPHTGLQSVSVHLICC